MDSQPMFFDCPAYLDSQGAARCGLPAEVRARYVLGSTDGPLECAAISCPRGHHFSGPVECLRVPGPAGIAAGRRRTPRSRLAQPKAGA